MSASASPNLVRIGIIGGGLMGRETASVLARWFTLFDVPVRRGIDRGLRTESRSPRLV
jgi:hypothetical protein